MTPSKLTPGQLKFLHTKKLEIGGLCSFPRYGFTVYEKLSDLKPQHISTNPFTRSLDHELLVIETFIARRIYLEKLSVEEMVEVNFYKKPLHRSFFIPKAELEKRDIAEVIALYALCYVPFRIYNYFRKEEKK